jgi:hypothetical protein
MKSTFIFLIVIVSLSACTNLGSESKTEKSPYEKIADEIGRSYHTDSLYFQEINDKDYVNNIKKLNFRLSYYSKVNEKVNPEMTSMFAYLFVNDCDSQKLNGDIVTVKLSTQTDSVEKSYFFNDFRTSRNSMKIVNEFLKAYQTKNFENMRTFFDEGFSQMDIDNALQAYKKVDSLYGPITDSELVGLNFLLSSGNDSITEIRISSFHRNTNTRTKHIYHVNRKNGKFDQLSLNLIGTN